MCPPDSSQPFLVNGIAYRHTLPLYLILEMAMSHSMVATLAHSVMQPVSLAAKQAASDGHCIVFPPHGCLRSFAKHDRIESAHVPPGS
jgi:hypothetical protein